MLAILGTLVQMKQTTKATTTKCNNTNFVGNIYFSNFQSFHSVIDASSDSPHLSTFGVPSPPPPPLLPDLPAVEIHDTSFTNQANQSEFGNFLAVPDRVSVEYKEEVKKQVLSFDLPKIRTSMGRWLINSCGVGVSYSTLPR
jgi:hypothetical protein